MTLLFTSADHIQLAEATAQDSFRDAFINVYTIYADYKYWGGTDTQDQFIRKALVAAIHQHRKLRNE